MNREQLIDIITDRLSGTYWCSRVWSPWVRGTMHQSDFTDVNETDIPYDLADTILAQLEPPTEEPNMTTDNPTHVNPITLDEVHRRMHDAAVRYHNLVKSVYDTILPSFVLQVRMAADKRMSSIYFRYNYDRDLDDIEDAIQLNSITITDALEMLEKAHPGFNFSGVSISDNSTEVFDIGCHVSWDVQV